MSAIKQEQTNVQEHLVDMVVELEMAMNYFTQRHAELTSTVDPDTATWGDVAKFAMTHELARHVMAVVAECEVY